MIHCLTKWGPPVEAPLAERLCLSPRQPTPPTQQQRYNIIFIAHRPFRQWLNTRPLTLAVMPRWEEEEAL